MTLKENYLKFLNETITGILKANNNGDISVSVHDEFYYDKDANLDVTLKFLPGQIQNNIPQYPAEIFIQVDEEYKTDVLNAFNAFIETYNETIQEFGNATYKQFYTLPSILAAFQNGSTKRIVTAQISVSLFYFESVCGINSILIDNEPIGFLAFNMSLVADTNSTGGINTQETKSEISLITRTLILTFIPKKGTNYAATERILDYLLSSDYVDNSAVNYNVPFSITINRTFGGVSKTWQSNWIFKEGNIAQEINGFPTVQVTFARRA